MANLYWSEYRYRKDLKSEYKYVFICQSKKTQELAYRANFLDAYGKTSGSKLYETEREAAIAVDMNRINHGKEPINILKRKQ